MEILLGLIGFLVLVNLITIPTFGAGLFRIVFGEILGAIFNPFLKLVDPWDETPKYTVDDKIDEWEEDEFVGWCTLPTFDYTGPRYSKDTSRFETDMEYRQKLVLQDSCLITPRGDHQETKEEDRRLWSECYEKYKTYGEHASHHFSRYVTDFEVYRKKDGTYYAWPDAIAMNLTIKKSNYEEPLPSDSVFTDNVWYCPMRAHQIYAESLIFYYDMPWILFNEKDERDDGKLRHNDEIQIVRGDYPLILERCENNNYEIDSAQRYFFRDNERRGSSIPKYGYRVISKGHLRMYKIYRGKRICEITKDAPPGRDPKTWVRKWEKTYKHI